MRLTGSIKATRFLSPTSKSKAVDPPYSSSSLSSQASRNGSVIMDLIVRYFDGRPQETYQYHEIENLASEHSIRKNRSLIFITGNRHKIEELQNNVKSSKISIETEDLKIPEIQDEEELNIVIDKCRSAFKMLNGLPTESNHSSSSVASNSSVIVNDHHNEHKSVLVEDTCLHFEAMNGMPGPYIKSFVHAIGPKGLHKMLMGFDDKRAHCTCTYALMDDLSRVILCRGLVRGKIISPRGSSWGWDPVFEEERSGMTFGEMGPELKAKFSHRSNAITVLKKYLTLGESTFS